MNVLLCGASGFIGRHVAQALATAGHHVVPVRSHASRKSGPASAVVADFRRDTQPQVWLERLEGIDAVVNAVGVLRDTRARPMREIHERTPKALFDACAEKGVRRVIHVSALGIEGNATAYAQTKLAAEAHLLRLNAEGRLAGVALRPSIVFGKEGASAGLFMALARSPVLLLPRAVIRTHIQPVAVQDLAQAVARLLRECADVTGILPCVGPARMTIAAFIACLREQLGHRPAQVWPLPDRLSDMSARVGDFLPWMPWCSETLALLAQDNVAAPEAFKAVLGRPSIPPTAFLRETWS